MSTTDLNERNWSTVCAPARMCSPSDFHLALRCVSLAVRKIVIRKLLRIPRLGGGASARNNSIIGIIKRHAIIQAIKVVRKGES
jgi:hypothetical protein